MRRASLAFTAALAVAAGCQLFGLEPIRRKRPPAPPTFSLYHQENWDWGRVDRVLVLPFLNNAPIPPRTARDIQAALTSKLQELGQFEVVSAPEDDQGLLTRPVHRGGRFDEAVMLDLGRAARADVIIAGTVTHYSAYPRQRLGLVLQGIGPREGKVVASVDGLWDTTDGNVAERCRAYYRQSKRPRPAWVRNHVIVSDDAFAGELALDSPALFQRFVCHEAALGLLGLPIPWVLDDSAFDGTGGANGAACPR
jgi:hypothetical protein